MSLEQTEIECAIYAVAPRVALADIEAEIAMRYDMTADEYINPELPVHSALTVLSICILVMMNGFTVIGKSAPASIANFNRELGKQLAYEDAVRQIWPLMGYALRDKLSQEYRT